MIRPTLTKKELIEKEIVLEEECQCDECKKIIYRKKNYISKRNITIADYHENMKKYYNENPIEVSFFKIQFGEYCLTEKECCKNCYEEAIKKYIKKFGTVRMESIQEECYYTEIKGDEPND